MLLLNVNEFNFREFFKQFYFITTGEEYIFYGSCRISECIKTNAFLNVKHSLYSAVEHQFQLVLSGGLTLMISLLTEATDEEVKRAAMFVLYTCKRIRKLHM